MATICWHAHALSIMCSRLGCLAGHKVNAANGLSVNGVIKIGLQKDKSNVYNVCEPGGSVIVCICVLLL